MIGYIVTPVELDLGTADDFAFVADRANIRALIEGLRETAELKARELGGHVVTTHIPETAGPTPATSTTDGGNVLLYAIKWQVEIPDSKADELARATIQDAGKWA